MVINPYNALAILNLLRVIFNLILKQAKICTQKKIKPENLQKGFYT